MADLDVYKDLTPEKGKRLWLMLRWAVALQQVVQASCISGPRLLGCPSGGLSEVLGVLSGVRE